MSRLDKERAILVGVVTHDQTLTEVNEYLDELALLADTAGADIVSRQIQEKKQIDPAYFIGKGKADILAKLVQDEKADLIIFDEDLSPGQMRNLEKRCQVKILDRSGLILDIFAKRAKTKEAKTQVELAQLQYLLPRLTRRWTHFSRQAGGAGIGLRGPGEKQLEVDRRLILKRISKLKNDLDQIAKQRQVRREHRTDLMKVALVGYTNAGKSTLLNALTQSDVFVEDRLFATLDSTVRRLEMPDHLTILLIDTVGFIRKLPHHLIASFKSTLEETEDADLLLHVIDLSSPYFRDQMSIVKNVMDEMKLSQKEILNVFNKIDRLTDKSILTEVKDQYAPCVFISAERGIFLDKIKEVIIQMINQNFTEIDIRLDINRQKELSQIYGIARVLHRNFNDSYVDLRLRIEKSRISQLKNLLNENINSR